MRLQVRQIRIFPRFLDAGKRQLHATDVRQHLERFLAQSVAQVAGHAVEQRVAAGHDGNAPVAGHGAELGGGFVEVGAQRTALGLQLGQKCQDAVRAEGRDDPFEAALEPVARRMERVKLSPTFVRDALTTSGDLELNELAMRWAGMPNKNERAAMHARVLPQRIRSGKSPGGI